MTAKSSFFEPGHLPSPGVLGLTKMPDPRYMDLADYQVHALWTWLSTKSKYLGFDKHVIPTFFGLG